MTRRDPNFVDVHVGSRIRMRRQLIGMSQEKLGELLGITFQQVQKYEKGANRISASRLYFTAKILGVPVQFFFEDLSDRVLADDVLARLLTFNNVIITSHQGFFTREAIRNIAETTLKNIDDFFAGRKLENEVCFNCGN